MNTFIKFPDSLTSIPEISKLYASPAYHILMVLLRHVYHSDSPAYNNPNHRTAILAEKHLKGEAAALFSNSMLRDYTGLSRDAVIRGVDLLERLKLINTERIGQEGTIYYLGRIDRDNNNTLNSYLMEFGAEAETYEGARKIQNLLMREFKIAGEGKEIHNISFKSESFDSKSSGKIDTVKPRRKRKKYLKGVDSLDGHWIQREAFEHIVDSVYSMLNKQMGSREKAEKIMKQLLEEHGKDVLHKFEYNLKTIQIDNYHIGRIKDNYKDWLLAVANGDYSKAEYASD